MLTIYRLQSDKDFISQVQKATATTEDFGIEPMHGLFGARAQIFREFPERS